MSTIVESHEAKIHLSRLLERVKNGEEIISAEAGKPCARLVPLAYRAREFGFVEGTVPESFLEALPNDELDRWEKTFD